MSDNSAEGRRDPAVLRALLDRAQAAEGPDREIDFEFGTELDGFEIVPTFGMAGNWYDRFVQHGLTTEVPDYTASIDACVTLLRHALPQSFWSVCDMEDGPVAILVRPTPVGYIGGGVHAKAATPPLAFLAALLKSLIAKAEEGR